MPSGYEQSPDYGGRPPVDPRGTARLVALLAWVLAVAMISCWIKYR